MKRIIISLIFVTALTLVCGYTYLYLTTKNNIDSLLSSLEPNVKVKYEKFSNLMDGTISIHNVLISSNFGIGSNIDSIEFKLDSVLDYLSLKGKVDSGEIIKKMQLKINHSHIDLSFIEAMLKKETTVIDRIMQRAAAQGCGDVKSINYKNLSDFGYEEFDGSINLDFVYDKHSSIVDITFDFIWHDMTSYSFKTSMPNIVTYIDLYNKENEVIDFQLEIQDLGYNERWIKFCSEKSGVKAKDYVQQHMEELRSYLKNSDVHFSEDIYSGYKEYLSNQAMLTFNIKPDSAVSYKYIDLYKPSDWPVIMGLDIIVGDKKISDLSMDWDRSTVASALLKSRSKKKLHEEKITLKRITYSDFKNNIGSYVEIKTRSGKFYKGFIVETNRNKVTLEIKSEGSVDKVLIHKNSISRAFLSE